MSNHKDELCNSFKLAYSAFRAVAAAALQEECKMSFLFLPDSFTLSCHSRVSV